MAEPKTTYRRKASPGAYAAAKSTRAMLRKVLTVVHGPARPSVIEALEAVNRVLAAPGIRWDRLKGHEHILLYLVTNTLLEVKITTLGPGAAELDQMVKDASHAASFIEQHPLSITDPRDAEVLRRYAKHWHEFAQGFSKLRSRERALTRKPNAKRACATAFVRLLHPSLQCSGIRLSHPEMAAIVNATTNPCSPFTADDVKKLRGKRSR